MKSISRNTIDRGLGVMQEFSAAMFKRDNYRKIGAFASLLVRLLTLITMPIASIIIVGIFLLSSQGRETIALTAQLTSLTSFISSAAAIVLVIAITGSIYLILNAYSRAMRIRLAAIFNGIPSWSTSIPLAIALPVGAALLLSMSTAIAPVYSGLTILLILSTGTALFYYHENQRFMSIIGQIAKFALLAVLIGLLLFGMLAALLDLPTLRQATIASGPLAVLCLGLAFWTTFFSLLLIALPIRFGFPSLLLLPLLLVAFWSGKFDYNDITRTGPSAFDQCDLIRGKSREKVKQDLQEEPMCNPLPAVQDYFKSWLLALPVDDKQDYIPVFLVATEGGGIRAAYWTSATLAALDSTTANSFSQHVFAVSGVSGGTMGAMAYYDGLKHRQNGTPLPAESWNKTFRQDFLSPIIFGLLFSDTMRNLTGPFFVHAPTRAELFEKALADAWHDISGSDAFLRPFLSSFAVDKKHRLPVIIANGTVVESGNRFLISNTYLDPSEFPSTYFAFDPGAPYKLAHLSGAQVAHLSARFPYVSPPASIRAKPSDYADGDLVGHGFRQPLWGHVVDGGYFENSGTTTLLDLYTLLQRSIERQYASIADNAYIPSLDEVKFLKRAAKLRFYAISIRNDPFDYDVGFSMYPREPPVPVILQRRAERDDSSFATGRQSAEYQDFSYFERFSELVSPPVAMLGTREARAVASRKALSLAMNGTHDPYTECRPEPSSFQISPFQDNMLCWMYGGRFLEVNLAEALYENMEDRKCGADLDARPALGWALNPSSATIMDCVLKNMRSLNNRVKVILAAVRRADMDTEVYRVLEGWKTDPQCKTKAGRAKLAQGGNSIGDAAVDPECTEPSTEKANLATEWKPSKLVVKPCHAIQGQRALDAELLIAAFRGDTKRTACLLKRGANVNARDPFNNTPLLSALNHRQAAVARKLLAAGASVAVVGESNITPLIASSDWADIKLIRMLLEKGADVHKRALTGVTPLMVAANACRNDIMRLLLTYGADVRATDQRGFTAAGWARHKNCGNLPREVESVPSNFPQ